LKDYYLVMNLTRNASPEVIKARYWHLAALYHPDKNPGSKDATAAMAQINEAYAVLGDPKARRGYDLLLKVKTFTPPVPVGDSGALDLLGLFEKFAASRGVSPEFMAQVSPVLERKLGEHGVKARAATAEKIMEAVGWLKPKRKKRA
jgi:curved DNA-binding protein CbpA